MSFIKRLGSLLGVLFATLLEAWRDYQQRRYHKKLLMQCWLNIGDILYRGGQHGILLNEETGQFSSIYDAKAAIGGVTYIQQEYDYQKERIARIEWLFTNGFTLKGV